MVTHSLALCRPRPLRIVAQINRHHVPATKVSAVPRTRSVPMQSIQRPNIRLQAQARQPIDDNWVSFDGEEEWDEPVRYFARILPLSFRR